MQPNQHETHFTCLGPQAKVKTLFEKWIVHSGPFALCIFGGGCTWFGARTGGLGPSPPSAVLWFPDKPGLGCLSFVKRHWDPQAAAPVNDCQVETHGFLAEPKNVQRRRGDACRTDPGLFWALLYSLQVF